MKIQIRLQKEFGRILRFASGSICKYAVIILSSLILKLSGLEMGLHVYDGRDSVVLCINYKQKLSLNNDARIELPCNKVNQCLFFRKSFTS